MIRQLSYFLRGYVLDIFVNLYELNDHHGVQFVSHFSKVDKPNEVSMEMILVTLPVKSKGSSMGKNMNFPFFLGS